MSVELGLPRVAQTLDFTCGAACFESMYRFVRGQSLGEMNIAKKLGTLELGYTSPESIAELAAKYDLDVQLVRNNNSQILRQAVESLREVVFVTWWYEDSGHYSLIKSMTDTHITLMDPWMARENKDLTMPIAEFLPLWATRGAVLIRVQNRL